MTPADALVITVSGCVLTAIGAFVRAREWQAHADMIGADTAAIHSSEAAANPLLRNARRERANWRAFVFVSPASALMLAVGVVLAIYGLATVITGAAP